MFTISIITDLSLTYYGQDMIDASKQLLIRAVEGTRENLSAEHPGKPLVKTTRRPSQVCTTLL
jgi:hypothetical protein